MNDLQRAQVKSAPEHSWKLFIANANLMDIAEIGQELGISGTTSSALGFGAWGIEPTKRIEITATRGEFYDFLQKLFAKYPDEEEIYVIGVDYSMSWTRTHVLA